MNLPRDYISYNQIRLYQGCPQKYYYSYIEKVQTPISDKIFLGVVFHATVEEFLNRRIAGEELDKHALTAVFRDKFSSMQGDEEIAWGTPAEQSEKRGVAFVQHFLQKIAPEIDPLMVEKELEVDIPEVGIKLRGIIDLVEKDFSLTDFKTTTQKWSKERVKSSYLQMVIYKYLFERSFESPVSELKFRILYARSTPTIRNQLVVRRAADFDFEKMFDIIKYAVENISRGAFYKNEGFYCGFCEYKDICWGTK